MRILASNQDLYDYLQSLSSMLKRRGAEALEEAVAFAIAQASSSSAEFIGESRVALRRVLNEGAGLLGDGERADLLSILRQLDRAIDKR